MAMLPEINVLAHPSASAPRYAAAGSVASAHRSLPTTHFVAPVVIRQPNYGLRRLGVVLAVVATTVVSIVGIGSAGAERATDAAEKPAISADADTGLESAEIAEIGLATAESTMVIVQPGDTLWTIAERVAPTVDRREAVDELAKIAGGSMLEVGQRLEIPAILG